MIEIPKEWYFQKKYNLRKEGITYPYEKWQIEEILKCKSDIVYFYSNHIKIMSNAEIVNFGPYKYQETMIYNMWNNRYNIFKIPRQSGKTTTIAAFFLYLILFYENEICGIAANKEKVALEIVRKIQDMYRYLPFWMQQGIVNWQKSEFELENGSRIISETTSKDALSGFSIKNLYIDEMSKIEENLIKDFLNSISPTIASFSNSKVIISSTPKGYNYFAKMWFDAINKESVYVPFEINWFDVPGRDEKFKEEKIKEHGLEYWEQEYECEIISSGLTLIGGAFLSELKHAIPIKTFYKETLKIYKEIIPEHSYILIADCAEGVGKNYSAFVVIDISVNPFEVIATYRNNQVAYQVFPAVINEIAKQFKSLLVLIESNSIGSAVLEILNWEMDCGAVVYSEGTKLGLRTTKTSKATGCKALKDLIEYKKIKFTDYDLINEFYFFQRKNSSFQAAEGKTDDLVMCMVLFSYFTTLPFFKEYVDNMDNSMSKMFEKDMGEIMETVPVFGYMNTNEMDLEF